jgi:predicted nucleic acid-binding Zn ribbon protein
MGQQETHALQHNRRDEQLDLTPAAALKSGYKSSTKKDVTEVFGLQRDARKRAWSNSARNALSASFSMRGNWQQAVITH